MATKRATLHQHALQDLPDDLQLRIADEMDNVRDRSTLCLALPRLGHLAMQSLERYKDFVVKVGMALLLSRADVDDKVMRRYVRDRRATFDGMAWLNQLATESGSAWHVRVTPHNWELLRNCKSMRWVMYDGVSPGVLLLRTWHHPGGAEAQHFEGAWGQERMVRAVFGGSKVQHYQGARGEEQHVSTDYADGSVGHYEGESGKERLVRKVNASGNVEHYEGERGKETLVRVDGTDGTVCHYRDGWCVRRVRADGIIDSFTVQIEYVDASGHKWGTMRGLCTDFPTSGAWRREKMEESDKWTLRAGEFAQRAQQALRALRVQQAQQVRQARWARLGRVGRVLRRVLSVARSHARSARGWLIKG